MFKFLLKPEVGSFRYSSMVDYFAQPVQDSKFIQYNMRKKNNCLKYMLLIAVWRIAKLN